MIQNHSYIPQSIHPIPQAMPLVLPSTLHASNALQVPPTGTSRTLQSTSITPEVILPMPVPPVTSDALQARYPSMVHYYIGYNNNWGPAQEHLFSQHAAQMPGGAGGPSIVGPPVSAGAQHQHWRCLWVMNGTCQCPYIAIDFDELMLHLGGEHGVQGTAARRIECQWLTESGICGMKYRRDGFRRHIGTHLGLSLPCIHCGKSFSRADSLRAHVKKCHEKQE